MSAPDAARCGSVVSWLPFVVAAVLVGTDPVHSAFRVQPEFIADDWSKWHAVGGALCYPAARLAGATPLQAAGWSLALATAWEIGDAYKPATHGEPRWHDFATTSDGFSYSDIVYHMAGTYCAWLVLDAAGLPVWLSVGPGRTAIVWSLP
jgi:hypothetical protein